MAERDRSAPSKLLEDLESIRNLLDEDPHADDTPTPPASRPVKPATPSDPVVPTEAQLDIPLLQDIVDEQPSLEPLPAADQPGRGKPHNPFLPYDSLAKLAAERQQLDRLLGPQLESLASKADAEQLRLTSRLQTEAQLIMQELLNEMLPSLEQELQSRLRKRLEQIVHEHLQKTR
ncbi:hypothetical protein [Halopseudomonas salegens]|uniref:DNA polymerase III subunit chi n=1 Tax=Halopseudomonas salegens TaxID=1434072 RepID=A0A1H2E9K9_9GAMM|nr:hypothetical protein [Halopseudomonas salegens]SDT91775.1 hypothetical protein SAMN05216210_0486 [Halopseudomonas salegens]